MTTRPDLDAIEERLGREEVLANEYGLNWDASLEDRRALLTYCRELEEENKRFKRRYVEHDFAGDGENCSECGMGRNYSQHIIAASRGHEGAVRIRRRQRP